ncbi:hypothetical protein HZH68_004175 [Vespula germanica]|uniref:Uncharacterized protein n=1 Tax=Vespula germanica TaxID=30212 RepID=A0A834KKS5_VESGE|nr:hypothetical protein HZH68_004175 [Vespula germanica]
MLGLRVGSAELLANRDSKEPPTTLLLLLRASLKKKAKVEAVKEVVWLNFVWFSELASLARIDPDIEVDRKEGINLAALGTLRSDGSTSGLEDSLSKKYRRYRAKRESELSRVEPSPVSKMVRLFSSSLRLLTFPPFSSTMPDV